MYRIKIFRLGASRLPRRLLLVVAGMVTLGLMGGPLPRLGSSSPQAIASNAGGELSPAAARALEAKIQALSSSPAAAPAPASFPPIVITDLEANSYLKYYGREFLPPGVSDAEVHIHPNQVSGAAEVDFGQLNSGAAKTDDWGASILAALLKGKQRVSANGKLETGNGQGKVTIENVQFGTAEVPDWLVSPLLDNYVQKRYKIDLSKPLVLPDHVTRVELGDGRATFFRSRDKKS